MSLKEKKLIEGHRKLIEKYSPTLSVISRCMENQQKGIYDEASNRMVISKIVALACAGYSTINSASDLGKEAGIPVLDSVIAAGLTIWHLGGGQYDKNQ